MLEHGGRLLAAARQYGIPLADWLDLSTGISPRSWLDDHAFAPSVASWQRLPEDDDALPAAAQACYGAAALPVAGSQAAIQALPWRRAPGRVGLLANSYAEHAHHWQRAGHSLVMLKPGDIDAAIGQLDVLLLVHPDNPSGQCHERAQLLRWHAQLAARGGWLVLDEAFIDASPAQSLAGESHREGLIVLRSLGKFFGLAGARVGFVLAPEALRAALGENLGPWTLSGPARQLATLALGDRDWQRQQTAWLGAASQRLAALMTSAGLEPDGGCALFQWLQSPLAAHWHQALAAQGVLTRLYREPGSLRLGLPAHEADWLRLQRALQTLQSRSGAPGGKNPR
ncbi:MAG: threonine-phosphate decarboxylase CobD [Pseudomonadota bacterium]